MKKFLYAAIIVVGIFGKSEGMTVDSFIEVEKFTYSILQDQTDAVNKIKMTVSQIAQNIALTKPVRLGMLEELKSNLSDLYPFVTSEVESAVKGYLKLDVYDQGQETQFGEMLLESQKPKYTCLDIVLRAVRLLHVHDAGNFETTVTPYMRTNRLESYL